MERGNGPPPIQFFLLAKLQMGTKGVYFHPFSMILKPIYVVFREDSRSGIRIACFRQKRAKNSENCPRPSRDLPGPPGTFPDPPGPRDPVPRVPGGPGKRNRRFPTKNGQKLPKPRKLFPGPPGTFPDPPGPRIPGSPGSRPRGPGEKELDGGESRDPGSRGKGTGWGGVRGARDIPWKHDLKKNSFTLSPTQFFFTGVGDPSGTPSSQRLLEPIVLRSLDDLSGTFLEPFPRPPGDLWAPRGGPGLAYKAFGGTCWGHFFEA